MSHFGRAVVTGGAGFIGSHVAEALLRAGTQVLVLDNLSSGRKDNLEILQRFDGFSFAEADIRGEAAAQAIKAFKPEVCFHFAAQMNVRLSVTDPLFDTDNNVTGTVNLLQAFGQAGGKAFVFASTGGAIYGEQEYFPADEAHPVHAECPYGVSKKAGELYIEYFSRAYGFAGRAMRFANVYGPRQNPKGEAGVVAIFCKRLWQGDVLRINGAGTQTRDFVYVGDVVSACMKAAETATAGFEVYNVGTEKETNLIELAEGLKAAWREVRPEGSTQDSAVEHGPALQGEQMRSCVAIGKIQQALGWSPQVELRSGLRETLVSFCSPEETGKG